MNNISVLKILTKYNENLLDMYWNNYTINKIIYYICNTNVIYYSIELTKKILFNFIMLKHII